VDSQTIAELITVLTAKVDQIQTGVQQANQSIQDYEKQAKDSNKEASSAFGLTEVASIAAAFGIGLSVEKLIEFSMEAFEAAAHAEALEAATDAVATNMGYAAGATEEARKSVEAMGYTGEQAAKLISILVKAHMDLARASQLAKVALDIAALSGKSYGETLDMVSNAVNTGNARILRQAGIVTNVNQVLSEYAATLGKTAAQLTDQERRQAILNAIIEKGAQLHGAAAAAMRTSGGQLDILGQQAASAKEHFGELLSAGFEPVIQAANFALAAFNKLAASPLWDTVKQYAKDNWASMIFGAGAVGSVTRFMTEIAKLHVSMISLLPKDVQDKIMSLFSTFEPAMQKAAEGTGKAHTKLIEMLPTLDQLITKFKNLQVTQKDFADDTMPDILKKTDEYMKIQGMSYQQQVAYLTDLDKRFKLSADQRAMLAKHIADLENQENQKVAQAYTALMTQGFTEVANAAAQSFSGMVGNFQGATVDIAQIWESLLNKLVDEFIASGILDLLSLIPGLGFLAPVGGGMAGGVTKGLGFDDPSNDAMAQAAGSSKWWNDFANNYSKGYVDSAIQTAPSMQPVGAGGGPTINVHYYDQSSVSLGDPAKARQAALTIGTLLSRNGVRTS